MVSVGRLIALLLIIPLLDALLLVVVATQIGMVPTVALVVITALVGMLFVRAEGRHTLRQLQRSVAEGEQPTDQIVDGGLLLVAGAFLLTPGLVTDAVGFLLVLPPSRYVIREALLRFVLAPYIDERTGGFVSGNVYTVGFPGDDGSSGGSGAGPGPNAGGGGGAGPGAAGAAGDPFGFDVGGDGSASTTVDFEDVRDAEEDGDEGESRTGE